MLNKIITAELTGVIRMRIEGVLPSSSRGLIRMLSEIFFSSSSCSFVLVISRRASCTLDICRETRQFKGTVSREQRHLNTEILRRDGV
jgi:hypothetical protein